MHTRQRFRTSASHPIVDEHAPPIIAQNWTVRSYARASLSGMSDNGPLRASQLCVLNAGHSRSGRISPRAAVCQIDLWFEIADADVHRVIGLLPTLSWEGSLVGLRVVYTPFDMITTRGRYREAREWALQSVPLNEAGARPSPFRFDASGPSTSQ